MYRLFLIIICQLVVSVAYGADERILVTNRSADIMKKIFTGSANDMPLDGSKWYSLTLRPTPIEDKILIPATPEQMFEELNYMLPSWYKIALILGEGDYECSVVVNEHEYSSVFLAWIEVNWRFDSNESPARKMLQNFGIHVQLMPNAVEYSYCISLKEGYAAGINVLWSQELSGRRKEPGTYMDDSPQSSGFSVE